MNDFRKVSKEELEQNQPAAPAVDETREAQVDSSVVDELDPEGVDRPVQVEDPWVTYVPRKDFTGRVNQDDYEFTKGVPVRVPRDVANMLLEDEDRGYVRD